MQARIETWKYNAKGEVTSASHSVNPAFNRSYEFDGIGNRKKSVVGLDLTDPSATTYSTNALNQYSQISNAQISNRQHDADGNLTDDGTKQYVWDAENRLIAVKQGSNTIAEYAYDYQSRRISKTVGSDVKSFVYDEWNPIAVFSVTTLDKSYTWGKDLSGSMQGAGGVGGLLSVNDGSQTYYPVYDGNGNICGYVDSTGAVVAHYEYDSFGQVVGSGAKANDFVHQFSTKMLDSESGLHYYGYRFYDSSNGRWLGRDPLGELGGINIYGMLSNNTLNSVDILGQAPCTDCDGNLDNSTDCEWTGVQSAHSISGADFTTWVKHQIGNPMHAKVHWDEICDDGRILNKIRNSTNASDTPHSKGGGARIVGDNSADMSIQSRFFLPGIIYKPGPAMWKRLRADALTSSADFCCKPMD